MFKTDNEDEERVSGGKQTLGLMAFIVLVVGAVTMIINFALGIANDKQITTWYQLVPVPSRHRRSSDLYCFHDCERGLCQE